MTEPIKQPTTEYEAPDIGWAEDWAKRLVQLHIHADDLDVNFARAFLAILSDLDQAEAERDKLQKDLDDLDGI